METHCQFCGTDVGEENLYWKYPDWPYACLLVCDDCLHAPAFEEGDDN